MKKVGIITFYYKSNNIGGLLQSYAVQKIVESLGYESQQICYDVTVSNSYNKKYLRNRRVNLFFTSGIPLLYKKVSRGKIVQKNKKNPKIEKAIITQKKLFEEFEKKIPHSERIYNINTINEVDDNYDIFITGSDQVWNTGFLAHGAYYLDFTNKPRIAFSVSMGKSTITKYEESFLKTRLQRYEKISVRERALKELIEKVSNVPCENVLDPTLLINKDAWRDISCNANLPEKKYIFCYFLGDCDWQRKLISKFAKERDLLILDIPYITYEERLSDRYLDGIHSMSIGPREFISAIDNAEYVFSDSFHAIAFSINFNKQFFAFDRDGITGKRSLNSRIVNLLELFKCTERRISNELDFSVTHLDYDYINNILEKEKNKTINWLQERLNESYINE